MSGRYTFVDSSSLNYVLVDLDDDPWYVNNGYGALMNGTFALDWEQQLAFWCGIIPPLRLNQRNDWLSIAGSGAPRITTDRNIPTSVQYVRAPRLAGSTQGGQTYL